MVDLDYGWHYVGDVSNDSWKAMMTGESTNTILLLYGGGKNSDDRTGSVYRDFYSADAARLKFEKELRRIGRNIPQTSITKVVTGYRWHLK